MCFWFKRTLSFTSTSWGLLFLPDLHAMGKAVKKRPASPASSAIRETPSRKVRRLVSEHGASPYFMNTSTKTRQSVSDENLDALLKRLQCECLGSRMRIFFCLVLKAKPGYRESFVDVVSRECQERRPGYAPTQGPRGETQRKFRGAPFLGQRRVNLGQRQLC